MMIQEHALKHVQEITMLMIQLIDVFKHALRIQIILH
jgi:hypothetical protein